MLILDAGSCRLFLLYMQKQGIKQIASLVDQDPSSDEVQRLIEEWKKNLMQFMPCDTELLACIADTYKFDARFNSRFHIKVRALQ